MGHPPHDSIQLLGYLPVDSDDRIRIQCKTSNGEDMDISYVFSKENSGPFIEAFDVSVNGPK